MQTPGLHPCGFIFFLYAAAYLGYKHKTDEWRPHQDPSFAGLAKWRPMSGDSPALAAFFYSREKEDRSMRREKGKTKGGAGRASPATKVAWVMVAQPVDLRRDIDSDKVETDAVDPEDYHGRTMPSTAWPE